MPQWLPVGCTERSDFVGWVAPDQTWSSPPMLWVAISQNGLVYGRETPNGDWQISNSKVNCSGNDECLLRNGIPLLMHLATITVDFILMCIHGIYNSCNMHEYQLQFISVDLALFYICWLNYLPPYNCYINHSFQTTFLNSNEHRPSSPGPQCLNGPPRIWVPCGWRSALVLLSWKRLLINNSWLDHRKNLAKLEGTTRTTEHKEKVEKNLNGCIHTTTNQSTCV